MKFKSLVILGAVVLMPRVALAVSDFDTCFSSAATKYSLDIALLKAIAKTESGFNPKARNTNNNGSEDLGIMQINTSWLPTLNRYGVTRETLYHPCTNIHIGAWVLANNFSRYGKSWKAVGAYNSPTEHHQQNYIAKVYPNYLAMRGSY